MAKTLDKVDVVTVGVGWTGGIVAAECAKAGLKVVGLERGRKRGTEDYLRIHDEYRYAIRYELMQDLSKETITFRNTRKERALPMRQMGSFLLGEGLGGSGTHWNGWTFRFLPYDFEIKSRRKRSTEKTRLRKAFSFRIGALHMTKLNHITINLKRLPAFRVKPIHLEEKGKMNTRHHR